MADHTYELELEWEPAARPIILAHASWPVPPFFSGMKTLTIERDAKFRLHVVGEGLGDPSEIHARNAESHEATAGSFRDADEATFEAYGAQCTLRAFLDPSPGARFSSGQVQFRHEGQVLRFARSWRQRVVVGEDGGVCHEPVGPTSWRTDWYINGPRAPLFMRSTKRRRKTSFLRERPFGTVTIEEVPRGGGGRDHFVVEAAPVRFAACMVPEYFVPEWCRAMGIEFREPLPDDETREAIGELASFVFGRRLLRLGSAVFDATGSTIEEEMINPVADNLRELCAASDDPPLALRVPSGDVETVLARLVPSYLKARDSLGLRNALWAYWSACEASTPIDLALFRGAVEALKKGWFESSRTKSKGVYMPRDEYERLTRELIDAVRQGLAGREGASTIIDKLGRAYQMGSNEQVRTFFEEIGLPIGATERAAMKVANVPAHGGITGGNLQDFVRHGRAYRTLFERTFLRLLGYEGEYVDRTTLGFPARPLDQPAGGVAEG